MPLRFIFILFIFLSQSIQAVYIVTHVKKPSAFHQALLDGDLEKVKAHLEKNKEDLHLKDDNKRTLLHLACLGNFRPHLSPKNQIELIKYLIREGLDLEAKDIHGDSPLHLAVWNHNLEATRLLTKHGAHIHVKNILGHSPFSRSQDFFYRSERLRNFLLNLNSMKDHRIQRSQKANLFYRFKNYLRHFGK